MELGAAPGGSPASYVSAPLGSDTTAIGGGAVNLLGEVIHAGRRSAGDDQRGAPRRQRNVRAERLDPGQRAQARDDLEEHVRAGTRRRCSRSRPSSHPTCSRCRPANSSRSRSRCTSRATPTVRVRASGSRSPRPTERSRCGPSARRSRKARPRSVSIAFGPGMPANLTLPVVPGRQRAAGAAGLPEPAQRALPALPGVRNKVPDRAKLRAAPGERFCVGSTGRQGVRSRQGIGPTRAVRLAQCSASHLVLNSSSRPKPSRNSFATQPSIMPPTSGTLARIAKSRNQSAPCAAGDTRIWPVAPAG